MKNILILLFIFSAHLTFSQSYTDTIYFKSGEIRAAHIFKESKHSIKYNYLSTGGRKMTGFARKAMINKYTIGDKLNSVATDFESKSQRSTERIEKTPREKQDIVGAAAAVAIVAISIPVGIVVGAIFLWNAIFG